MKKMFVNRKHKEKGKYIVQGGNGLYFKGIKPFTKESGHDEYHHARWVETPSEAKVMKIKVAAEAVARIFNGTVIEL